MPTGHEYALGLKVFYDNNAGIYNQTILAGHLNQCYISLINSGKIPMQGNGQVMPDFDGWQVAKNIIGATYGENHTQGTNSNCN